MTETILRIIPKSTQGSHMLEMYLNLVGFHEKSLKIKSFLKSTGKSIKSLEKSFNYTILRDFKNAPFYILCLFGLNIFYLYTLYIEQHIKTYNNIQYTNGIQKKVFRLIRICIPFKISILLILSRFREKTISVPMLNLVLKCTTRVWKLFK